jgi:fructoselysine-6-P-deglycase FrlB-like protein
VSTPIFSAKLDALPTTLDLFRDFNAGGLADALATGGGRHTVAVGSGGSAIAAEYLVRCRDTLGLGPTTVQTPMQVVLESSDLGLSEVWLFSAGGDNPDILATVRAAQDRGALSIHLVTRNPDGEAARLVSTRGGTLHAVPVSNRKDGFLATHSLLSSVTALLLAADLVSRDPRQPAQLLDSLAARLVGMRATLFEAASRKALTTLRPTDTLLIAADPLLRPLAILLDTSSWEASLCPVQITDLRNLAHGRHSWLHHRGRETLVLALTTADSRPVWAAINGALPSSIRRCAQDHGAGGRLDNALAIIDGLGLVEVMGKTLGIDPGKPGIADYGRVIYDDRSLARFAETMLPNVRHKRAAIAKADTSNPDGAPLDSVGREWLAALEKVDIGGAVLDYDGTVVTTAGRWSVPEQEIIDELTRLLRLGFRLGIATGRGGSAGEDLRKVLPADLLRSIVIGYYNGGHVRTAEVDIEHDPAQPDPAIQETAAWLDANPDLFSAQSFKCRGVQITIDMDRLWRPYRFLVDLGGCAAFAAGRVKVLGSGHSYDIIPSASTKLAVVDAIRAGLPADDVVLCLGDSGSKSGNDHALLAHANGISVGEVCGAAEGCWSLFGSQPQGPNALLRILRALLPVASGKIRLDVASLGLDSRSA